MLNNSYGENDRNLYGGYFIAAPCIDRDLAKAGFCLMSSNSSTRFQAKASARRVICHCQSTMRMRLDLPIWCTTTAWRCHNADQFLAADAATCLWCTCRPPCTGYHWRSLEALNPVWTVCHTSSASRAAALLSANNLSLHVCLARRLY